MSNDIPSRLSDLRAAMTQQGMAACLIPGCDPHMSEYLPQHWQAREHFSGFDGSAGTLVVTPNTAALWTDSRYFEQAETQLAGTGVALMRLGTADTPGHVEWLAEQLADGTTLAVAGDSISLACARRLHDALDSAGVQLRTDLDLPGSVWRDRPSLPAEAVHEHAAEYAVIPRRDKLARVRDAMRRAEASHHFVSTLDDIAWLTNLRGSDVDYNPVFVSHLLLETERCTLFVDAAKVPDELARDLANDGIELADYRATTSHLEALSDQPCVMFDPANVAIDVIASLPEQATGIELPNPSTAMKAIKDDAQLVHVREVMRQDGAALVRGFHRVEQALASGATVTELDVGDILYEERAKSPGFYSESFGTIAGYMANGALPHYSATPEHYATLHADGLLLVDSGGQYFGGTTDITRVWAFGATTAEQRQDFTVVMKGAIGLSAARFPQGASGPQLDALARAPIWAASGDYGHGTGHGVGYFLNVHEGPHSVRPPRSGGAKVALEPGMITSIEPGLYKPDRHGIRHENLAVVRSGEATEFGQFLYFETLTLCPFDTRALEPSLLSPAERDWLNAYQARVLQELEPLLDDDGDRAWLRERCAPLP